MSNKTTAKQILKEIGGTENVVMLTHCATRLRFTLKDATIIDSKKMDSIDGVMGVVPQGNEAYQVVIGGAVADVFQEINSLIEGKSSSAQDNQNDNMSNDDVKAAQRAKVKGKSKFVDSFFEFLSDSFRPIIGVLLGASLIIAIVNLLISFNVIADASDTPTTMFLNAIAQSVFYFLPVLIAYNACKKLKVDPWVGAVCMLALFTPHFLALMQPEMYKSLFSANGPGLQNAIASLTSIDNPMLGDAGTKSVTNVFGLPMILDNYKGNVFVPLLMSGFLGLLYKGLKKIIPSSVQLVFVPFFAMLITVPLTAFIIGPIGVGAGSLLGLGLSWLNTNAPFIFAIAIPLLYPFLVPLGLHWPLNALMLLNIDTLGYDFIQGPMGCWNFACFGATFGVLFHAMREKDSAMTSVAGGALAAGLLGGVSEPSLYGIHLRYKKVYKRLLPGCAAGGICIAILGWIFPAQAAPGVTTKIFAFTSLLTIPVFDQMWVYALSILVAFAVSAILVILFDYRTDEQKTKMRAALASKNLGVLNIEDVFQLNEEEFKKLASTDVKDTEKTNIYAPVAGKIIDIKKCGDSAFESKFLGEGIAIKPKMSKLNLVAPLDCKITNISKGNHAYTLITDNGVGILIHIGVDTIKLKGKGIELISKEGSKVKKGDILAKIDFTEIDREGFNTNVIVTIVNTNEMKKIETSSDKDAVKSGDLIITTFN